MAIYSLNHSSIGKKTHEPGTAAAHLRYITRPNAAGVILSHEATTTPAGACNWINREERADRANARVVDKVMVAIPVELNAEQRTQLIRNYADIMTGGVCPWFAAIHDQGKDASNPHAHIVFRDRHIDHGKRHMMLSEKGSTERLRQAWEAAANKALMRCGYNARISCRSLQDQGIDRLPQIHEGPRVRAMEDKGERPKSKRHKNRRGDVIDYPALDEGKTRPETNKLVIEINKLKKKEQNNEHTTKRPHRNHDRYSQPNDIHAQDRCKRRDGVERHHGENASDEQPEPSGAHHRVHARRHHEAEEVHRESGYDDQERTAQLRSSIPAPKTVTEGDGGYSRGWAAPPSLNIYPDGCCNNGKRYRPSVLQRAVQNLRWVTSINWVRLGQTIGLIQVDRAVTPVKYGEADPSLNALADHAIWGLTRKFGNDGQKLKRVQRVQVR